MAGRTERQVAGSRRGLLMLQRAPGRERNVKHRVNIKIELSHFGIDRSVYKPFLGSIGNKAVSTIGQLNSLANYRTFRKVRTTFDIKRLAMDILIPTPPTAWEGFSRSLQGWRSSVRE